RVSSKRDGDHSSATVSVHQGATDLPPAAVSFLPPKDNTVNIQGAESAEEAQRESQNALVFSLFFSARPLRSLRLCGELTIHNKPIDFT
ncbi:MAG TPA: hypothetical protein VJ810_34880, partial [Blastocatellia bacterium]|nr:hypothetical protein [Blastocatellia bacterium]